MAGATVVSAPGKVLLAGGYLILERQHTGLVLGLDARIFVATENVLSHDSNAAPDILVCSPQFVGTRWSYRVRAGSNDHGIEVEQASR